MVGIIAIAGAVFFALVAPIATLIKYYSPKDYSTLLNIFWILVTIVSWPLIPIIIATRRKDKLLLSMYWVSFLVMAVAGWYWCLLNVNKILQFQQMMQVQSRM